MACCSERKGNDRAFSGCGRVSSLCEGDSTDAGENMGGEALLCQGWDSGPLLSVENVTYDGRAAPAGLFTVWPVTRASRAVPHLSLPRSWPTRCCVDNKMLARTAKVTNGRTSKRTQSPSSSSSQSLASSHDLRSWETWGALNTKNSGLPRFVNSRRAASDTTGAFCQVGLTPAAAPCWGHAAGDGAVAHAEA